MSKKAVVLLSGGLDSTTCLALAISQGYQVFALSFDYGQRHIVELNAAKAIAVKYGVTNHYVVKVNLPVIHASSLTNAELEVPSEYGVAVPNTYVPGRNTLFLSYALGLSESLVAESIWIGCSSVDYSNYPDCRPEFIESFQALIDVVGQDIKIHAPLMHLSKQQTIELGLKLGVDYSQTVSCYNATEQNLACGACDSCYLREKGFSGVV